MLGRALSVASRTATLRHVCVHTPRALFSRSPAARYDADLREVLQGELKAIEEAGTYKHERTITSPQGANVTVESGNVLNFCANNYLGLSNDRRVAEAGRKAIDTHGMGLSSVRFICGTQDLHKDLEQTMSSFHGTEDCILYPSCFDANAGLFEGVLTYVLKKSGSGELTRADLFGGAEDAVISDELNHASIIDGIRLCKAKRYRYKHMDLENLEQQLKDAQAQRLRMVVTDGVFSMDGEVAPLKDIADLCDKYKVSEEELREYAFAEAPRGCMHADALNRAILMIDECHGTGVIGKTGRGTPEYYDMMDRVDIINSTFGKALGGATGGYTAGPKEVVDILRQRGRPYLFSNSLAPATAACAREAVRVLLDDANVIGKLKTNTMLFRSRMTEAGFELRGEDHPIAPVMLGDARLASEFADDMLKRGIYVIGFSYPVVPKGLARIRVMEAVEHCNTSDSRPVQLSAAHSEEDVNKCVDAFIEIGKARSVIQ